MEHVPTTCARLVAALEDLTARETGAFAVRDAGAIYNLQRRAASVVTYLCEHADAVTDPALRSRITAVAARRQEAVAQLGIELERMGERIAGLRASQRRIASVGPVYGRPGGAAAKRLSVVG